MGIEDEFEMPSKNDIVMTEIKNLKKEFSNINEKLQEMMPKKKKGYEQDEDSEKKVLSSEEIDRKIDELSKLKNSMTDPKVGALERENAELKAKLSEYEGKLNAFLQKDKEARVSSLVNKEIEIELTALSDKEARIKELSSLDDSALKGIEMSVSRVFTKLQDKTDAVDDKPKDDIAKKEEEKKDSNSQKAQLSKQKLTGDAFLEKMRKEDEKFLAIMQRNQERKGDM